MDEGLRTMTRGDPERIRQAQAAGFVMRLASARSWDRDRAAQKVEELEAELIADGIPPDPPDWSRELERRAGLA